MIINTNVAALNTFRQLSANQAHAQSSLERLSSGLRINRAGDDAAGLAISEKMRGQIRGLDQAARNAQDAISLIQTAEGGLNETHSILQRMRELAVQAASDTNVEIDRAEIQNEINHLSSEINRIGNTTEFNTQKLLRGDGSVSLDQTGATGFGALSGGKTTHVEATLDTTILGAAVDGDIGKFSVRDANGISREFTITFAAATAGGHNAGQVYNVTANSATVNLAGTPTATTTAAGLRDALSAILSHADNADLQGGYSALNSGAVLTLAAVDNGAFEGGKGVVASIANTNAMGIGDAIRTGTTTLAQASGIINFSNVGNASGLLGGTRSEGININGVQLEFYDATQGPYTGNADIAIHINANNTNSGVVTAIVAQAGTEIDGVTLSASGAHLIVRANAGGEGGNTIATADGGVQAAFQNTFQVGANKGQSFTIDVADMRSEALNITGAAGADGFTAGNVVTNGTDALNREAALDMSTHTSAAAAVQVINNAIEAVSSERSKMGAFQNRLEHTINNLGTSSENLTAAESRIRDVNMAQEMMEFTKNNILAQAATAMLAQANQMPQGVLQLLR